MDNILVKPNPVKKAYIQKSFGYVQALNHVALQSYQVQEADRSLRVLGKIIEAKRDYPTKKIEWALEAPNYQHYNSWGAIKDIIFWLHVDLPEKGHQSSLPDKNQQFEIVGEETPALLKGLEFCLSLSLDTKDIILPPLPSYKTTAYEGSDIDFTSAWEMVDAAREIVKSNKEKVPFLSILF